MTDGRQSTPSAQSGRSESQAENDKPTILQRIKGWICTPKIRDYLLVLQMVTKILMVGALMLIWAVPRGLTPMKQSVIAWIVVGNFSIGPLLQAIDDASYPKPPPADVPIRMDPEHEPETFEMRGVVIRPDTPMSLPLELEKEVVSQRAKEKICSWVSMSGAIILDDDSIQDSGSIQNNGNTQDNDIYHNFNLRIRELGPGDYCNNWWDYDPYGYDRNDDSNSGVD
ncbi:hypothetical protein V8C42DRAFT_219358 [Trichoderma barbatum]